MSKTIETISSEYDAQAEKFLYFHGITIKFVNKGDKCPTWGTVKRKCDCLHGDHYRVYFRRGNRSMVISFWNSYNDKMCGETPRAYDVLACLQKSNPGSFADFCGDFGYSDDSITAMHTYKECVKQWEKMRTFFTETEISELQDIN